MTPTPTNIPSWVTKAAEEILKPYAEAAWGVKSFDGEKKINEVVSIILSHIPPPEKIETQTGESPEFEEGVKSVIYIRCCPNHHQKPQRNKNAHGEAECGECCYEEGLRHSPASTSPSGQASALEVLIADYLYMAKEAGATDGTDESNNLIAAARQEAAQRSQPYKWLLDTFCKYHKDECPGDWVQCGCPVCDSAKENKESVEWHNKCIEQRELLERCREAFEEALRDDEVGDHSSGMWQIEARKILKLIAALTSALEREG